MKKIIISIFSFVLLYSNVLAEEVQKTGIQNPLKTDSIPELIGLIIQGLLGITGSIALVMFIYGGIMWLISGGNPDQVKKGKQTIIWATMGLVIIFSAYAILKFVFQILTIK